MSQPSGRIHLVVLFPPKQCSEGGASNIAINYYLLLTNYAKTKQKIQKNNQAEIHGRRCDGEKSGEDINRNIPR